MPKNYGAKLEAICTITHPRSKAFYSNRLPSKTCGGGVKVRRVTYISIWGLKRETYDLLNKIGWIKGLQYKVNGFMVTLKTISTGDGGSATFDVIRAA